MIHANIVLAQLNGVTCKLFGTVIRYLIILRDNYVGNWINFTTIDEYRQRRQDPDKWLETKRKQAESKVSGTIIVHANVANTMLHKADP